MRKASLFALFFLFTSLVCFAQLEESQENTWDFGKIRVSGGIVKHIFSLKNDSSEPLNVNGTNASCGCTVSEIDKKIILPGESANLEVKFDPKGYSSQITQYIYVDTDSKTTPIYKFTVKANIIKEE